MLMMQNVGLNYLQNHAGWAAECDTIVDGLGP